MSNILGIDGEAIDGEYCILGSGSYRQLSLRGQLTSQQCFDFLIDCASRHSKMYGYGIGYDVCNWIKDLTVSELDRLAKEGRTYTELGLRFYRVVYRPQVMFRVDRLRGMPTSKRGQEIDGSATIVDLMRWHRKPFSDVANDWSLGYDNGRATVRSIKSDRPNFSEVPTAIVERYNRTECEMIAELGEEMEHGLRQLGLPISSPLTCGGVAGLLANRYRVQDYRSDLPTELVGPVQSAFYGGRMQTCRFGRFFNARHCDIRSAYAWAMSQLPDMLGGWKRANIKLGFGEQASERCKGNQAGVKSKNSSIFPETGWGLRKIRWNIPEGEYPVMPFPHRNGKGYISYPPSGTGWYWLPLVRAAMENYPASLFKILDGWDYVPASDYNPFWYMEDLHGSRMALKRTENPLGDLLKLIMVSTWGRMCSDGIRHRHGHGPSVKSPTRGLIDWSGMTTALIQARILKAILVNPKGFISCCVDGYWTTGREGPSFGDNLGDWSAEYFDELFLVRQSCYWKRNGSEWEARTSGIPNGGGILEAALEEWNRSGWGGKIPFPSRTCSGLLQCANIGEGYENLGEFRDLQGLLSLNPGMMRYGHLCPTNRSGRKEWEKWLPYWPPQSNPETESEPFTPKCDREMIEETLGEQLDEMAE